MPSKSVGWDLCPETKMWKGRFASASLRPWSARTTRSFGTPTVPHRHYAWRVLDKPSDGLSAQFALHSKIRDAVERLESGVDFVPRHVSSLSAGCHLLPRNHKCAQTRSEEHTSELQ